MPGTDPPVYRSRFERSFTRYTWHGAADGKEGYWTAEYRDGRIGYFELLQISGALRRAISENRSTSDLWDIVAGSHKNMRDDGVVKAAEGLTTIEEVLRATHDAEDMGV